MNRRKTVEAAVAAVSGCSWIHNGGCTHIKYSTADIKHRDAIHIQKYYMIPYIRQSSIFIQYCIDSEPTAQSTCASDEKCIDAILEVAASKFGLNQMKSIENIQKSFGRQKSKKSENLKKKIHSFCGMQSGYGTKLIYLYHRHYQILTHL